MDPKELFLEEMQVALGALRIARRNCRGADSKACQKGKLLASLQVKT